jgi:hypothetical protein
MNQNRTMSILQRVPVILAVTAASYGLTQAQPVRHGGTAGKANTSINHTAQQKAATSRSR